MITYHRNLIQGTDEWKAARCGILTASSMKLIITPGKLQYSNSDKERSHLFELAAQSVTQFVEPIFVSDDMLRGTEDEIYARAEYAEKYAPVEEVGFITNNHWGFTLGYSPDGLVGENGLIEIKSRRQKYQFETIVSGEMPVDYVMQVQTGMLVAERQWCDFISYSGGMPMATIRVYPDPKVQAAILEVAEIFHEKLDKLVNKYSEILADKTQRLIPTERRIMEEITL